MTQTFVVAPTTSGHCSPDKTFLFLTILNTGHVHKGKQAMPNPRDGNVWALYMHAQTYAPQTYTYYRFIHQ